MPNYAAFLIVLLLTNITPVFAGEAGEGATQEWTNQQEIVFVWVPPGNFMMGSPDDEAGRGAVEVRHRVELTKGFWLGKYEVTQKQWQKLMGSNPSTFIGPDNPVENLSWSGAQDFVRKLNSIDRNNQYRLPTEAEWEYAARAGSTTAYSFGDDAGKLGEYAWYFDNAERQTHPVGTKKANRWGLHDMHGNVWEWTADWIGKYPGTPVVNPAGPESGSKRVTRGGNWTSPAASCRSAARGAAEPEINFLIGFRLVRTPRGN